MTQKYAATRTQQLQLQQGQEGVGNQKTPSSPANHQQPNGLTFVCPLYLLEHLLCPVIAPVSVWMPQLDAGGGKRVREEERRW